MKILRGMLVLMLASCSAPDDASNKVAENRSTTATQRVSPAAQVVPEAVNEGDERYFPAANYLKYPANVRALIRRADILNDECRGRYHVGSETACARRDRLHARTETLGWCWGGSFTGVHKRWLPCSEDHPGGQGWIGDEQEESETGTNDR